MCAFSLWLSPAFILRSLPDNYYPIKKLAYTLVKFYLMFQDPYIDFPALLFKLSTGAFFQFRSKMDDKLLVRTVLALLWFLRLSQQRFTHTFNLLSRLLLLKRQQDTRVLRLLIRRHWRRRLVAARLGPQKRRAWIYPRLQLYFEELLINRELKHQWKEHFRVNRNTFDFICHLVSNEIQKQNTQFRQAVPVVKRVATSLWRLGSGECYLSVGLNFALGEASSKIIGNDFVNALVNHHDQFIYFSETEQESRVALFINFGT